MKTIGTINISTQTMTSKLSHIYGKQSFVQAPTLQLFRRDSRGSVSFPASLWQNPGERRGLHGRNYHQSLSSSRLLRAGIAALLLALAITSNRDDIADALYDEGLRGSGDTLAAVLWSISLYFCTPWQTLLIFLGRVDTERPSDWLMAFLAKRAGLDASGDSFSYPLAVRIATVVFFAIGGTAVAQGLSSALGDATWSLSTGLGSCLIAGIYEVGRPERLSSEEADHLDAQYKDFVRFADERLQPRGSCHETEIFTAFRRSNARYRTEEALSDLTLRRFIRSWAKQYVYPTAERTSSGYFKRISVREQTDPFTGASTGRSSEIR